MNELARKRPATIVDTRPVLTYHAPYHHKTDLVREVNRLSRRGEVRPLNPYPIWIPERGQWEQRVVRLRPPAPRWRKPLLIGLSIVGALALLTGLGYWVLASLAALPLQMLCGAAFVFLIAILAAGRTRAVEVIVTTVVRVNR